MASFWDRINPLSSKSWTMPIANKSFRKGFSNLLMGTPEKHERVSTLLPEQQGLFDQLLGAGKGEGAGGAFGTAADYYRGLLSNENADINAFTAPAMRQYQQDIVPNISEQFAQMGGGGQGNFSSSGFRNAQIQGATDLAERLGAIRANLRQAGAQGLQGIGSQGLQNFSQDVMTQPGTQGMLGPALGAVGTALGGPALGAIGAAGGSWLTNSFGGNKIGANTSPYQGGGGSASPRIQSSMESSIPQSNFRR